MFATAITACIGHQLATQARVPCGPGAPGGPAWPSSPFWPGSPLAPLVPGRPGVPGAPGSPFSPFLPSRPVEVFNVKCTFLVSFYSSAYQAVLVFQHLLCLLCLPFLHSCRPFLALQEDPSLLVLPCLPCLPYLLSPPCPPWLQDILGLLCLLYYPSLLWGWKGCVVLFTSFTIDPVCMCREPQTHTSVSSRLTWGSR